MFTTPVLEHLSQSTQKASLAMQLSSKFMSVPISNYICIYDIRSEHYVTKHEQISAVYKSPKKLGIFCQLEIFNKNDRVKICPCLYWVERSADQMASSSQLNLK